MNIQKLNNRSLFYLYLEIRIYFYYKFMTILLLKTTVVDKVNNIYY